MDTSGVPQVASIEMVLFKTFIGDMGSGIEYAFGKFAHDTNTLEGRDAFQRD